MDFWARMEEGGESERRKRPSALSALSGKERCL